MLRCDAGRPSPRASYSLCGGEGSAGIPFGGPRGNWAPWRALQRVVPGQAGGGERGPLFAPQLPGSKTPSLPLHAGSPEPGRLSLLGPPFPCLSATLQSSIWLRVPEATRKRGTRDRVFSVPKTVVWPSLFAEASLGVSRPSPEGGQLSPCPGTEVDGDCAELPALLPLLAELEQSGVGALPHSEKGGKCSHGLLL